MRPAVSAPMQEPPRTTAVRGPSFSLVNRLTRVVWGVAWFGLARWTPPPLHAWRRLILLAFGARVARGARVYGSARIWLPANLTLAEDALVGPRVTLYNQGQIAIGPRSVISQGAHICASTHDVNDPDFTLILRPVAIGADCWVAADAFVGPGAEMAQGSVLGARGALFEKTKPMGVYRGNPAVFLKRRQLSRQPAQLGVDAAKGGAQ